MVCTLRSSADAAGTSEGSPPSQWSRVAGVDVRKSVDGGEDGTSVCSPPSQWSRVAGVDVRISEVGGEVEEDDQLVDLG